MEKTKYFESQEENEEVIYLIRKHWFTLVSSFLGTGFFYLLGFLGIFVLPHFDSHIATGFSYNIYVLIISLVFVFPTAYLFQVLVLYYLNVILVTNEHLVEVQQARFFSRNVSELKFDKVQDVASKENGIFQSLLGFGTIEVQTAGENRNFVIANIPKPSDYAEKIMELEEKYKNKGNAAKSKLSKSGQSDKIETEKSEEQAIVE